MTIQSKKLLLCLLTAMILFIVACDQSPSDPDTSSAPVAAPVVTHWDAAVADSAQLINVLPDDTLAYVRLPTLWGLLAAPKSGALASALGGEANRDTVMALQARIPPLMEAEFGDFAPLLSLLLETLRSPLEIALVGDGEQALEADLIIEARLAMDSVDELNDLLGRYASPNSPFQQLQQASNDEPGQLLLGLIPMFYHFDGDSQRVRMVGGMSAGPESLEQSRSWNPNGNASLKQREQTIEDSGQGLMVWADGTRLMPALEQMASADDLAELRQLGLLGLKEFALAYGNQDGKARLSLVARGEDGPVWDYGLAAPGSSSVPISGEADYVAGWFMPDHDWISRVWRALSNDADKQIAEIDGMAMEATGLGLVSWIDAFAGRWILIGDDSGTVMVHEATAPDAWNDLISGLGERFELRQTEVESQGQTLRHLVIPGLANPDLLPEANDMLEQVARFVAERMMAIGTHIHWMEDKEGRRVLASVPQVLRDRIALSGDESVASWLSESGVTHERAALFGAIEIDDAPRRNYYSYLTLLQAMGDMLDTDIDLHAFPSAHELGMANQGSVGVELHYANGTLGLGLLFENHPGDVIYSGAGGLAGLAVVGILAAVAIPAYQDYAQRAVASEFMIYAAPSRLEIAEFYATEGRLPSAEEVAQLDQRFDSGPLQRIYYDARLLRLVLELSPEAGMGENAILELVPVLQDGMITRWRCASPTLDDSQLPDSCG